ncbi:Fic family protein [Neisseria iguanae]|uniref:Addiction module protein n=1 Tax=Neisseria iguanae TaxID=90242 RepID=A0A2P7TZ72_9NEIS|nr:Fic family protein [Neisseria iguanae]PSJ79943.1 addiction module protein [Neisseria iguanae]
MYSIEQFPPSTSLESVAVLKKLTSAHRYLAELKGICRSIPNQAILINTLSLQEAKDSSEIENIITTHDELFRASLPHSGENSPAIKEVQNYSSALHCGFELVVQSGMLTNNHILAIQAELEKNRAGFRQQAGTMLKNDRTGEVVYEPPQHTDDIVRLMGRLETFINDESTSGTIDPLVRMALIHHQFESIHPFYDGNGRTGRIINVLYLVLLGLMDIPVLYLSRYLVKHKNEYYRLLQYVRDTGEWESWILYMLEAVEQTAKNGIDTVQGIHHAMMDYKHRIRQDFGFYSQDLINHLFNHPYTKIEFMMKTLNVSRPSAAKYLDELTQSGFLHKEKIGRSNYYINIALMAILLPKEV